MAIILRIPIHEGKISNTVVVGCSVIMNFKLYVLYEAVVNCTIFRIEFKFRNLHYCSWRAVELGTSSTSAPHHPGCELIKIIFCHYKLCVLFEVLFGFVADLTKETLDPKVCELFVIQANIFFF